MHNGLVRKGLESMTNDLVRCPPELGYTYRYSRDGELRGLIEVVSSWYVGKSFLNVYNIKTNQVEQGILIGDVDGDTERDVAKRILKKILELNL